MSNSMVNVVRLKVGGITILATALNPDQHFEATKILQRGRGEQNLATVGETMRDASAFLATVIVGLEREKGVPMEDWADQIKTGSIIAGPNAIEILSTLAFRRSPPVLVEGDE